MFESSWTHNIAKDPQLATVCTITNPTIIYQNESNQLMAHSNSQNFSLPIRKQLIGLASLPTNQVLMLSRYELNCFDLLNNNQIFNLQFENAEKLFVENGFIYVISGSDIFCYNYSGEEQYVNHCSSSIQTMITAEIKGVVEVIVGLGDLNMIRFKGVNVSFDYGKIVGVPTSICWIDNFVLVGVQEGTVALYQTKKAKWKAKSSHPVYKIKAYRTESDYLAIVVRKDGLVELKDWKNKGQTFHKVKLYEDIIHIQIYDFRKEDNQQLICILKSGTVKAFNIYEENKKIEKKLVPDQIKIQNQNIQELLKQKLNLEYEINQLKQKINSQSTEPNQQTSDAILSPNFKFVSHLNHQAEGLALIIECTEGYISGLSFQEPIMPLEYDRQASIRYIFKAENLIFGQINCNLLIHSNYTSRVYQVKQFKITLPKFWKFNLIKEPKIKTPITNGIRFTFVERNARYIKWIHQCFFVLMTQEEKTKLENLNPLRLRFNNAYEKLEIEMNFIAKDTKIQFWCDDLKILGEILHDLIQYVGIKQLDSQLWFPKQKQKIKQTLEVIERLSQTKISLSSEMAEAIDNIKFLLVKSQSARIVSSIKDFRKSFTEIMGFNRNLMTQIEKKNQNTKQLSESLKILGQLINQTSNVRYGKPKQAIVIGCREAIKKKDFTKIITIMEKGQSGV